MVSSESAHGPLTVAENFPCLHLNAAVRSLTVPVTWPLILSLHLEDNEDYVSGSLMGHDYPCVPAPDIESTYMTPNGPWICAG